MPRLTRTSSERRKAAAELVAGTAVIAQARPDPPFSVLLPWLNGRKLSQLEVNIAIASFFGWGTGRLTFQGDHNGKPWPSENISENLMNADETDTLRDGITRIMQGHSIATTDDWTAISMRFKTRKIESLPNKETPSKHATYEMVITGDIFSLLMYQIVRVLTEPNGIVISRCTAWKKRKNGHCLNWFIVASSRKKHGQFRKWCSDSCRVRASETGISKKRKPRLA